MSQLEIVQAESEPNLHAVRELFLGYASSLGFDLCFQDFEQELAELPGCYAPPDGRLLLAVQDGEPIGCVGLRKLAEGVCEMKRLYVRPTLRMAGIGRKLATAVIDQARRIGYRRMQLDTVGSMAAAMALYRSLGFVEIPAYTYNPISGAMYFELVLEA